jgi:hypothetical protein
MLSFWLGAFALINEMPSFAYYFSLVGLFGDSNLNLCRTFLRFILGVFKVKISEGMQSELTVCSAVLHNISNNISGNVSISAVTLQNKC